MRAKFAVGDQVISTREHDGARLSAKLTITQVDDSCVRTSDGRYWTKTGLRYRAPPGANRAKIRHWTAADDDYFECQRLATTLKRLEWSKLDKSTLTAIVRCLPSDVFLELFPEGMEPKR